MVKKYVFLDILVVIYGIFVFLEGLYKEDMDFNSMILFGYYNLVFILKVIVDVKMVLVNFFFRGLIKEIYFNFEGMVKMYKNVYFYINEKFKRLKGIRKSYL